jgi:hypothetical protein
MKSEPYPKAAHRTFLGIAAIAKTRLLRFCHPVIRHDWSRPILDGHKLTRVRAF